MRQLRHSYHVSSIKHVAFDVADSAFYNVHMIGMSLVNWTSSGEYCIDTRPHP